MKIKILTGVSIAIITWLTLSDLKVLRYGMDCISELNGATEFETFGLRLCAGNLLFKLTGILLAIIGLIEVLRKAESFSLKLKLLLIYTSFILQTLLISSELLQKTNKLYLFNKFNS